MKKYVFILSHSVEMRFPYDKALKAQRITTRWVSAYDELIKASKKAAPASVIVDIDLLPTLEAQLEGIRLAFPESDLLALSAHESAQAALQCVKCGFTDVLLKPISPEELAFAVRKAGQRSDLLKRLDDPKASMVRAVTQISTCSSPTLVRLCAIQYLRGLLGGAGAAWLKPASASPEVACSLPKRVRAADVVAKLPAGKAWVGRRTPLSLRGKKSGFRKVFLPCQDAGQGVAFLWGVEGELPEGLMADAELLVRHAELSLMNFSKLEEVKQQTFVDDLTGLYNSRYLKFALESEMGRCKLPGQAFSVLFIDVDHFKSVNDRHGHLIGSEFLVAISRTMKNAVRSADTVFRYGGDEFVVILQGAPLEDARIIAERIRHHVEKRIFHIGKVEIQTTVSIGLATYPQTASKLEELLELADKAMYAAKRGSRNAVRLASPADLSAT